MDSTWAFPPSYQYGDNNKALQALAEDWPSSSAKSLTTSRLSFIDFQSYEQYPDAPAEFFRSDLVTSIPHTETLIPPLQAASADPTQDANANRCSPIHGNATLQLNPPSASDVPIAVQKALPSSSRRGVSRTKLRLHCRWSGCAYNGTFGRKADLMRHIDNTHVDPRAHRCLCCGSLFNRKDNLDEHLLRVHAQN
ncbi:uncharacterized protein APUU_11439S [Aspergillus puulaauensis]|uniref:C2H2-type domain-containing protein n=1 Tax=Aspergillus puulaauensis TaxID=1220207 RepID=A0A7R8AH37_9EURO|nr:uncharacterized protein APUU_11439S [Aspergillus puulaauensis]BCS18611.1 hypothetical protein APUU_11439S [Aspergillus puulaauensis]